MPDTAQLVLIELGRIARVLENRFESSDAFVSWMAELGWNVPDPAASGLSAVATQVESVVDLLEQVEQGAELDDALLQELAEVALDSITAAKDLPALFSGASLPPGFSSEAPGQIALSVFLDYLEIDHPLLYAVLRLIGVITLEPVAAGGSRPAYEAQHFSFQAFGRLFTDPRGAFRELYGWGEPAADLGALRDALQLLAHGLGIPAHRQSPTVELSDGLYSGLPADRSDEAWELRVPILEAADEEIGHASAGVALLPLFDSTWASDGLALVPYADGELEAEIPLGERFVLRLGAGIAGSVRTEVRYNRARVVVRQDGSDFRTQGKVEIALKSSSEPTILFGERQGSRLEVGGLSAKFAVEIAGGKADCTIAFALENGKLVISAGKGDGFLQKILAGVTLESRLDLGIGWSTMEGLFITGSAGLEVTIPIHRSLGPVNLESILVGVLFDFDDGGLEARLAITAGFELGPIAASVSRIGIQAKITQKDNGNLGPLNLGDPAFLPPTGAGLSISAGAVTGGGFIKHDPDAGSYAGILDLKFTDIGLVAVAIITTKLPGGRKGFALFINIGVTFSPPITLPYLFYLSGCGGLCAVNRTMDTEALRSGLRNKTLDSILFPVDPIQNASKIISDSERVFPIEEGRFVIGPMAKLGWGTGGLVTANIAIVLELPAPIVIALLGQVKVRVPQSEESKVKLNLDILGVLEIEKKSLSFDASLYDSKVLVYELYGDAALRLRWGSSPQFAMSVGGFHPKFTPPANFPSLRRLTIALRSTSSFELSATMYHALTSNTLQFGAKLRLYAAACGASLEGHLSFDTLFQFSPFEFDVGISGGLSARFHGRNIASVKLSLDLSGHTPWHAKGKAKVSVLCWDVTARFSKTWGSDDKARVAKVDPLPPFLEELEVVGNWSAALSPRRTIVETLKSLEASPPPPPDETPDPAAPPAPDFLVHPAGALAFRQRLLPLDMKLEKFKSADVKTHFKFDVLMDLGPVTAAPDPTDATPCLPPGISLVENEVKEHFAKAQFKSLSKSDRLSRASYERFRAGLEIGPGLARVDGCVQECELEYESILIMPEGTREQTTAASGNWALMKRGLRIAALRRASMRHRRRGKFAVSGPGRVGLKDEAYAVVDKATLTRVTQVQPLDAPPLNQTQALDLLDAAVAEHLVAPGSALVVPEFEEVMP